jgi:hypothetical protein
LYNFSTASDDGSQLFIDNRVVVDNGGPHGLTTRSGSIRLDAGSHTLELRYVQFAAVSALDWSWAPDGADHRPVSAWVLTQRRTTYGWLVTRRLVEWSFAGLSFLVIALAGWYVSAVLTQETLIRWLADRRQALTKSYPHPMALVVPAGLFIAILFTPWAVGGPFFKSVENTFSDLNRTAVMTLGHFAAFRANIDTPQAGEHVVGSRVEEMLAILRGHDLQQYGVSAAIAENSWVLQQIVATGWPRRLEKDAKARFALNTEPVTPGCSVVEAQREVSLVYCP